MRSESVNKAHKEQITSVSREFSPSRESASARASEAAKGTSGVALGVAKGTAGVTSGLASTAASAVSSAAQPAGKVVVSTSTENKAALGAVNAANTVAAQQTATADDIDAPVAAENTDAAPMTLESSLSLDADFIDLAPMPDAVVVEPSFNTYNLSRQSLAFADSISNSLMDPHGVQFGGIAGLNWSGAAATNTTGKVSGTPLTGFTLGLFADIPLKKQLSFRPELLYSYEGYQPVVSGEKVNIHVAYLNMPLDLVYRTNLLGKRFFIGGGPYLAYAFNGTYTMKGTNTDMQFGSNLTEGANLRNTDFGAHLMAGILLDRNFILGVSANLGLSNIAPAGTTTDIHTRSFGLSIGYVFRNRANSKTY